MLTVVAALACAYAARAGFTHVVVLHGDDQGFIGDLLPVLERGDDRTYDACLGARFAKGARLQGYSRFRTFGNHVFNALFTPVSFRRVQDLGSGLNIFAHSVFANPAVTRYADDLRSNVHLLLGMIDQACRITFFPISWREDDQISNVKMVSQSLRTLKMLQEYALRRNFFRTGEHRDVRLGKTGACRACRPQDRRCSALCGREHHQLPRIATGRACKPGGGRHNCRATSAR